MHRFGPIPDSLKSTETGEHFSNCYDCNGLLTDNEDGYIVQQVFSKGEAIMEIAVCEPCHKKLYEEYSDETKERIWNFYLDHGDLPNRLGKFNPIPIGDVRPWLNHCLTCKATLDSLDEYSIAAHCVEELLIYGESPFMICSSCMEKIVEMLSEKSLGTYDRWLERCLPMAPAQPDDSPKKRVLI